MAKKQQTKKSQKNTKKKDLFVMIGSIALTVVLVVTMILNAPIIDYRTITNGTMSTRQISIMKYFKVWQPLVQKAMKILKTDTKKAIYVGDSEVDIQTAENTGLPCVSVMWGFRDAEFLRKNRAQVLIQRPLELLYLI